jgi:hypothetical protein
MPRDYPPEYDYPLYCDVCGKELADCICPECPVCHTWGRPECYTEHGLTPPPGGPAVHKLSLADMFTDAPEPDPVTAAATRSSILDLKEKSHD